MEKMFQVFFNSQPHFDISSRIVSDEWNVMERGLSWESCILEQNFYSSSHLLYDLKEGTY